MRWLYGKHHIKNFNEVCQHYQNHFKKINKAIANGTICGLPSLSDISHLLKKYQGEREKVFRNSVSHNFKPDRMHILYVKVKLFTPYKYWSQVLCAINTREDRETAKISAYTISLACASTGCLLKWLEGKKKNATYQYRP